MSESYISVSQINTYIKNIFEAEVMLQNICVFGEVSSYNISNGIAYFNLKDENGLLNCVLFGAKNFDTPKIGDMILARGSVSYYAKGGKLSFNAVSIMPYGRGLLYEKFLELKNKLAELGYFDESIKKPIPTKCRRIGVVTSSTGAVIHDIIDVTHRRNDTIDIVLYPVKVQGIGAEFEIANGINFFSEYPDVDVIIVARGGGSMEDLEPFNTEIVANAVYKCKKTLVSAVGHETDFTIIDFVSDRRAPTPSAAAEIVAWDKYLEIENIDGLMYACNREMQSKLQKIKKDIDLNYNSISMQSKMKCQSILSKLRSNIDKINRFKYVLDNVDRKVEIIKQRIENYNPANLSAMGYSKVLQNNKVINSIGNLDKESDIVISMIDGEIKTKVIV